MHTKTENLLGLSALESGWGSGPFVVDGRNNYFSLHSPAPFESEHVTASKAQNVKVATFKSYEDCLRSFAKSYGPTVQGITDGKKFAEALQKAKKFGINPDSSAVSTFVPNVTSTIHDFAIRLDCK